VKHSITVVLADLPTFDSVIDVRSPAEFAEDHVPGSINCPVLDDAQRAEVGTIYKQASPFAARRIGAAMVAENIARHLRESISDRPKHWRPLVYCWRGGQRSGAMTTVLRQVGWDARQLEGGYKAYRRHVVAELAVVPTRFRFEVIAGPTGCGKSRLLKALAERGAQTLDLEALACHKGSVLGLVPGEVQPTQKRFESTLLQVLSRLDHRRPVFVEAESRRIGALQLPEALITQMRGGRCVTVDAPLPARVAFLLADYDYFVREREQLAERLRSLRSLRGAELVDAWLAAVAADDWRGLVESLLTRHYDPLYRRSQAQNYRRLGGPLTFACPSVDAETLAGLADEIIARCEPLAERIDH
jgi:tRNA 2-selenouridine synthase